MDTFGHCFVCFCSRTMLHRFPPSSFLGFTKENKNKKHYFMSEKDFSGHALANDWCEGAEKVTNYIYMVNKGASCGIEATTYLIFVKRMLTFHIWRNTNSLWKEHAAVPPPKGEWWCMKIELSEVRHELNKDHHNWIDWWRIDEAVLGLSAMHPWCLLAWPWAHLLLLPVVPLVLKKSYSNQALVTRLSVSVPCNQQWQSLVFGIKGENK